MMLEKKKFQQLTSKNLLEIYNKNLVNNKDVLFLPPLEAGGKLESIVATVTGSVFGVENYITFEEKTVAYMYFLIKDHPFVDGNKRMAVYVLSILSEVNQLKLEKIDLAELAVYIEGYKGTDYHRLIRDISQVIFSN